MLISRRDFLKTSAVLLPAFATMPVVFRRAVASSLLEAPQSQSPATGRTLLIVQMAGGNDGLNTVIPYSDHRYYDLRPEVAIPQSEVLPLDADIGLHPALAKLKTFWEEGILAIVEGVGYPDQSYSHFESMRIWQTADRKDRLRSGWLGRYFETLDKTQANRFPGLAVGKLLPPECSTPQVPIPVVASVEAYQLQTSGNNQALMEHRTRALLDLYRSAPPEAPYSVLFDNTVQSAVDTSDVLQSAANGYESTVEYPATPFGAGLKVLAQAIVGDLGVKVGHITLGGFDTHAAQLEEQSTLLRTFSEGIFAFHQDLRAHGKSQNVVVMTWSEFGRRARSNASDGTDHGSAGPMFILGDPVLGGLYGQRPDLGYLYDDNLFFTTDYRRVYATVLEQWLEAPADAILGTSEFEPIPLLVV